MFPHFTEPGNTLSCAQGPPTVPTQRQMNLIHTHPSCSIQAVLILFSHPCIGLASCPFASDVSSKTSLLPFSQACYVSCALGAFGNGEKQLLASSCLFICPVACNSSAPTRLIFMKFRIWKFFENLSKRLKFHWNLTRITGTLHEDQYIILIICAHFFL